MINYKKSYENVTEMNKRYVIFKNNMKIIQSLQYNEKGTAVYGATSFADLTLEEFTKKHTGYIQTPNTNLRQLEPQPLKDIPESFDWREKGAVTEVKNQGSCGSCWAFSTTGNIEGVWKVKKGQLVSLSEQQLVDCDKIDQGCGGGEMSIAYKEIERMGGLETEQEYPYQGVQRKCNFNKTEVEVYINDSIALPKDEKQMAQYLYENGPIAIAINAYPMMFYFGGISHPWKFLCSPSHLNHGVTIVGYGVEGNKPFWIIKNSWGRNWGESGYIRLFRGAGVCGVDQDVSSVIVD